MAMLRSHSRLLIRTPPPSPIATAKGLKSAAINDEILSDYLEKTLHIPDLALPDSYFPTTTTNHHHRRIPIEIDFSSIKSKHDDSIRNIFESVNEFGAFRLIGHGISADELQSTISEAELFFQNSDNKRRNIKIKIGSKNVTREEFSWFQSGEEEKSAMLREKIGSQKYRILSEKMDEIFGKLEAIAESVSSILLEKMGNPEGNERNQQREPFLCYYRYSKSSKWDDGETENEDEGGDKLNEMRFSGHASSLYLYVGDQKFHVNTGKDMLSCKSCSGSILVTLKKQFQECCEGKLECVDQRVLVNPSYALEFMFSPLSSSYLSTYDSNRRVNAISIFDQILIAIAITFLYGFFAYLWSIVRGK